MITVYEAFAVLTGALSGNIVLDERAGRTPLSLMLYSASILAILTGLWLLQAWPSTLGDGDAVVSLSCFGAYRHAKHPGHASDASPSSFERAAHATAEPGVDALNLGEATNFAPDDGHFTEGRSAT